MTDPSLARMHAAIVTALRARGDEALRVPFTVAEIYQDLIPYSAVRDVLQLGISADYEHLLMRLLSGEDGLLLLDSTHAVAEIGGELARPFPNTSRYRDYAALEVRLGADVSGTHAGEPAAGVGRPGTATPGIPAAAPISAPASAQSLPSAMTPPAAADPHGLDDCRWCRGPLPTGRTVNFCPHCGADMRLGPCRQCGEELEPDWRFCPGCGAGN